MFEFHLSRELKKRKVKISFKEDIEPQETFLDSLAQSKEEELEISQRRFETPLSKNILQGFLVFIFALISFLFVRTFQIQIIEEHLITFCGSRVKA